MSSGTGTEQSGYRAGEAPPTGRRTAARLIAWIMAGSAVAFGLFTAVFGIVDEDQRIHAFHNVMLVSLLLVLSAPGTILVARAPERSTRALTVLATVGIAGLLAMAISLTADPFILPVILLVGVLWVLRPSPGTPFPPGRASPALVVLVAAGAWPLLAYALGQADLQRSFPSSEHAEFYHWVETSFYAIAVLFLGVLAALRPAANRLAAWIAGVALAVLGGGSLALGAEYESALGTPWAWAALAGAAVFVAVYEWEVRRATPAPGIRDRPRQRGR